MESMGDKQVYYRNVGLETGDSPKVLSDTSKDYSPANGDIYETPTLPHHNKLHAIYLHVGKPGENKLYPISVDENGHVVDEKWRDFFALHEPTDDKVVGYVAQRQDALKRHPEITYDFQTGKSLPEKNYTNLSDTPTEEFLRAFVRKDELSVDGKNIVCSTDVNLNFLGVEKIPDLSDVHIKGRFYANDIKKIDMKNLPYASNGYCLSGETVVENCDKIDAETFCKKIGMKYENGMWHKDNMISGSASYLGCPKGLSQLNLKNLNFINLTIDNIEELPTTQNGADHIKITNQNSIKNMDAHVFLQKIAGTDYDKYPNHEYNANYNIDLNLSQTNITELPKGLNSYHINRIIFPEKASPISSLENIPVTKQGCYNLNFKGDLSGETMESFLLKTKGKNWCAENISKAADGHLIIKDDIDFNTTNYSNEKISRLDIQSFPKDIDKIEFKGDIEPRELKESLYDYRDLLSKKNEDFINIRNRSKLNYDLSDFKAQRVDVSNNFSSINLPKSVNTVSFSDIDNSDFSKINLDNVESVDFYNVKTENKIDLSKQSKISIIQSNIDSVQFPENCDYLTVKDSQFGKNVEFPKELKNLELNNVKFDKDFSLRLNNGFLHLNNCQFPDGCTLDLSHCSGVSLSDVDLSKVNVKLPETGTIRIHENVRFAPDSKLDFSNCRDAVVHKSVECAEIKLPQRGEYSGVEGIHELPKQVKEVTTEYIKNHEISVPDGVRIIDAPMENGKRVPLESLSRAGLSQEQIKNLRKERLLKPFKNVYNKLTGKNESSQPDILPAANNNSQELHETLKKQAEAAQQKTEVPQTAITDDNLRNTLKTQQKNSGIGGKASSVSNNIDAAFEKIGAALNDNAVGRTINTMDRWRPNNKVAAKAVDKVGVVPVAAIVGSGVAAYEQYKSGDTKGAAATMGKGVVHASVQGAATVVGINAAAKGAAKASEKITAKVVERKAAKTATKSAAKAAGKAAGKAVGKSILKKIPLVSLGAGAYFAYDRAKNGEWGKAGCELLSGALGCFPGVGTAASTAVDCGLAAADVKQSINETKKQQAAEQNKPQTTEQQKNPQMAKRINELRGNKTEQKKAVKAKPVEKNIFDRLKDSFLSR